MARSSKAEALSSSCCGIQLNGPREWMFISAGRDLLILFPFGIGVSGMVRSEGHWDHGKTRPTRDSGVFKTQFTSAYPHHAGTAPAG